MNSPEPIFCFDLDNNNLINLCIGEESVLCLSSIQDNTFKIWLYHPLTNSDEIVLLCSHDLLNEKNILAYKIPNLAYI